MKIYHKQELLKGYIPSDKVTYNHKPYEHFSITNFGIEYKTTKDMPIQEAKARIILSDTYKDIVKDNYHQSLYLNKNYDGIDCFIDR